MKLKIEKFLLLILGLKLSVLSFNIDCLVLESGTFDFAFYATETRAFPIFEKAVLFMGQIASHGNKFSFCDRVNINTKISDLNPKHFFIFLVFLYILRLQQVSWFVLN